jgi:hypothetical protein
MARSSSFGSRRTTAWAVDQAPRAMPRVVRLGRAANDNVRRTSLHVRMIAVAFATAVTMLVVYGFRLI